MVGIAMPDAASILEKYKSRAGSSGPYYESGVKNPKRPWAASAEAGVPNLKLAISAANFGPKVISGIKKAGDIKWSSRSINLGVGRYPGGIAAGAQDFSAGYEPYRTLGPSIAMPDRKPRGDPANDARSTAVSHAFAAKRITMAGAGV